MTNIEFAKALRAIAAHYEDHPDMPQPWDTLWVHTHTREEFIGAALALSKGGTIKKFADPEHSICSEFHAKRDFGGVFVDVKIDRKTVCRLVSPAVYDCPDSLLEEASEYAEVKS